MIHHRIPEFRGRLALLLTGASLLAGCALPPLPAGSRAVAVDGQRLVFAVRGERGIPLVVLAGHGALGIGFVQVLAALDPVQRVVWIDRPGLGWSEAAVPALEPETTLQRLRQALARARLTPPYVLLGHSYGGALAMRWAQRWPDEVAGLVLASPTHPALWDTLPAADAQRVARFARWSAALPWLARSGVLHLLNPHAALAEPLPEPERSAARAFARHPRHLQALADEARQLHPGSALLAPLVNWRPAPGVLVAWLIESQPPGDGFDHARRHLAARVQREWGASVGVIDADHAGLVLHPAAARHLAEAAQALLQALPTNLRVEQESSP